MAVIVGETSGCLEVIGDYKESEKEIRKLFIPIAKEVWSDGTLDSEWERYFYNLSETEINQYLNREEMPDSFMEKFMLQHLDPPFLFHRHKPNTSDGLRKSIKKNRIFKVQCNRCGRIFYTDETSFKCVKWQLCLRVECNKSTMVRNECDSSERLYHWNNSSLQLINTQLKQVESITKPLSYYNSLMELSSNEKIAYISDMHLLHHANNNLDELLKVVSKNLYKSSDGAKILLFNGDISSDPSVVLAFFREFIKQYSYDEYKDFLTEMRYYKECVWRYFKKEEGQYILAVSSPVEKKLISVNNILQKLYTTIINRCGFNYQLFFKYKIQYCHAETSIEDSFLKYKNTKGYKNQKIKKANEQQIVQLLIQIDKFEKILCHCDEALDLYYDEMSCLASDILMFEEKYGISIEKISTVNFIRKYNLHDDYGVNAYVILGNHEFVDFADIQSGVEFYRKALADFGITILHNNSVCNGKILIYGGTGFAKYNEYFNASNLVCCPNFSRENELNETDIFEKGYIEALEYAKKNHLTFVCASHYSVDSCLNNHFDPETIYFTGHNHRNEYVYTETKVLYADNQIGYNNKQFSFKIAKIGLQSNPYYYLKDGIYRTSVETYLEFYKYLGEYIGEGAMLYKKCDGIKSCLYVVKHNGYYGFFIMTIGSSSRNGIFIVNGGKYKKITDNTDITWIGENFDVVLAKYLQLLAPLREMQERISQELKDIGLDGKIHGTIVDIDFYHHVMVNPLDGTIMFYYSPMFGIAQRLDTFEQVINSLENKKSFMVVDKEAYQEKIQRNNCQLAQITPDFFIESYRGSEHLFDQENPLEVVSRSEGAYGVSRKISPLQRLFEGKVLRDFDTRLVEIKQEQSQKTDTWIE